MSDHQKTPVAEVSSPNQTALSDKGEDGHNPKDSTTQSTE